MSPACHEIASAARSLGIPVVSLMYHLSLMVVSLPAVFNVYLVILPLFDGGWFNTMFGMPV